MLFHPMDIFIFIAFGLSIWASFKVRGTFGEWSRVAASSGMTGYEAARRMLDNHGLYDVQIEPVQGELTDHYDPINRVVRLSEPVYNSRSIAAISVACHEVGHAIQHSERYPMLVLRHRMFPVVNFASSIAPIVLIMGFLLYWSELIVSASFCFPLRSRFNWSRYRLSSTPAIGLESSWWQTDLLPTKKNAGLAKC